MRHRHIGIKSSCEWWLCSTEWALYYTLTIVECLGPVWLAIMHTYPNEVNQEVSYCLWVSVEDIITSIIADSATNGPCRLKGKGHVLLQCLSLLVLRGWCWDLCQRPKVNRVRYRLVHKFAVCVCVCVHVHVRNHVAIICTCVWVCVCRSSVLVYTCI